MHSTLSDGSMSLQQLADACRIQGYAFIAITDHNINKEHPEPHLGAATSPGLYDGKRVKRTANGKIEGQDGRPKAVHQATDKASVQIV